MPLRAIVRHARFKRENAGSNGPAAPGAAAGTRVQRIRELRAFRFVGDTLARLMLAGSIKAIFENQ